MEEMIWLVLGFFIGAILFVLPMAISFPYMLFGIKKFVMNWQSKGNLGLVVMRSLDGSLMFPKLANLTKNEFKVGSKTYPLTRAMFDTSTKMWGLPYVIMDADDVVCSVGYYYQRPVYQAKEDGTQKVVGYEPTKLKDCEIMSPELVEAFIKEQALLHALKQFLDHNKLMIILVAVAIIAGGAGAFFGYELVSATAPQIIAKLDQIIGLLTP